MKFNHGFQQIITETLPKKVLMKIEECEIQIDEHNSSKISINLIATELLQFISKDT